MGQLSTRTISLLRRYILRKQRAEPEKILPGPAKMPIVPTGYGVMLGVLLILMFVWSANHQLNLGYALTFLVAVIAMLGAGLTVGELAKLRVRCRQSPAVFAGSHALFTVEISDEQRRARGSLRIHGTELAEDVLIRGIAAGESVLARIAVPALARGWLALPTLTLSSTHPLGWFITWQWLKLDAKVLVYPLPEGDLPLPHTLSAQRGEAEHDHSGDDELSGLSDYHHGDPLSRVAWKRSGGGVMYIKQFSGQGSQRINLDLAQARGDIEARLSQLSKWIVDAHAQGLEYSLRLGEHYFAHDRSEAHYHACLRALALY